MTDPSDMLHDETVVCISSIDWDFIWQGHQQIMASLAAAGNRVLFIENTGVRRPNLRDMPRLRQRIQNWWKSTKGFREERTNLFVYSPLVLPFPYSRIARWVNRGIIARAIRGWLRALGTYRPIVWTFLPTPLARDIIRSVDPELTVYYCIDDFMASSAAARNVKASENRLLGEADLVFVTSNELKKKALRFREQVGLYPFAVDFEKFAAVREADPDPPGDLADIPRPVVGYIGGMHRFVDQELMAAVARSRPDTSFVFIGPPQCDLSTLEAEPNVHLLGARPHSELPRYINEFDIGTIPYIHDEYTNNVYPTKLNEYLAMGIPVIATPIPEIVRFRDRHGPVVDLADTADEFADAIDRSLAGGETGTIDRRIDTARENSWDNRLRGMAGEIGDLLEEKRNSRDGWDLRLKRIYNRERQRLLGGIIALVLCYLIVFWSPLVWWIASPLRVVEDPRPADAIVVFAGGVGESGEAGGGYQERVLHAAELYNAGYADRVILSSGYVFAFRESDMMQRLAVDLGVPAAAITIEEQAASTLDHVRSARDNLARHANSSAILVSSPYHMRRALLTWHRQAPAVDVIPSPPPQSQYYARGDAVRLEQIRGILWEYAAIAVYWLRGWI